MKQGHRTGVRGIVWAAWLALAMAACDHGGRGDIATLTVAWQVRGMTCSKAGLETVRITVTIGGSAYVTRDVACADESAVFEDLPTGYVSVRLEGLDATGATRYAVEASEIAVTSDGAGSTGTLQLEKIGAGMRLTWYFANNGLCSFNGVTQVEATVWYDQIELHGDVYACDPYGAPGVEGQVVPDEPGIPIFGLQVPEVDVVLFGLDRSGSRCFSGERHVALEEGSVLDVSVALEDCMGTCR